MRAVAFDLGDTLVEYEGMPLSWEAHYPEALRRLATRCGRGVGSAGMEASCAILRSYNTRLCPRRHEVSFRAILAELSGPLGLPPDLDELDGARAFFEVFRQRLRCFPETPGMLEALRRNGFRTAVFTDVPYGMPKALVLEDLAETGLRDAFELILTSRCAGFRKPAPEALQAVAAGLGCPAAEMLYVGNERKDIEAAEAFGCRSLLIDRARARPQWGQTGTIAGLTELGALLPALFPG